MSIFSNLWVEKYRPKKLDDVVLSIDDRMFLESLKTKQEIPHLLFAGTAGVGKTTTAKIIVNEILDCQSLYINASDENGIDAIRGKIMGFAKTKSLDGKLKVVLLDEFDGVTSNAMDALRNVMEEFAENTRFILTCNYLFKVIKPIQSRCQIINLIPPIEGVIQRVVEILKLEKISVPQNQKSLLVDFVKKNLPDIRRIINDVQKFSVSGILEIKKDVSTSFVSTLFEQLIRKKDLIGIRKFIIENEKSFSGDYRNLLKQLFEMTFEASHLESSKKSECLLALSKGMELDSFVIDKEINCFTALINFTKLI